METPPGGRGHCSRHGRAATLNMVFLAALVGCGGETSTKNSTAPPNNATPSVNAENTSPTSRAAELDGDWDWTENAKKVPVQTIVTFHPDGKATETYEDKGTWKLTGSELRVDWSKEMWTKMTLSADGMTLEGSNNLGMRVKATKRRAKR